MPSPDPSALNLLVELGSIPLPIAGRFVDESSSLSTHKITSLLLTSSQLSRSPTRSLTTHGALDERPVKLYGLTVLGFVARRHMTSLMSS